MFTRVVGDVINGHITPRDIGGELLAGPYGACHDRSGRWFCGSFVCLNYSGCARCGDWISGGAFSRAVSTHAVDEPSRRIAQR